MEFDFTEEQRILRDLCQKIAGDFPEEYWADIEDKARFPREFWDVVTEQGLLGISLPEEYGG
ncbi:MAG: acyl-CoA dehydrogenase, partial [Gammaproteobacteria bacterium]